MEKTIYFGRLGSYTDKDGNTNYTVDYMSENGITHRDKISLKLYQQFKSLELTPAQMVVGVFNEDIFNRINLVDITL